jgi:hypothetical protein
VRRCKELVILTIESQVDDVMEKKSLRSENLGCEEIVPVVEGELGIIIFFCHAR